MYFVNSVDSFIYSFDAYLDTYLSSHSAGVMTAIIERRFVISIIDPPTTKYVVASKVQSL